MWSKVLSSVDAIMKTSKKKVAEVEQHVEETSEVVEVMVVCDEDVETLLFLKGSKVKGKTPDKCRRRLSSTDLFEDEIDDDVFVPQAPKVLFSDSPGRAKTKLEDNRARRKSSMAVNSMQTIPESEEIKVTKKRVATDEGVGTPDRKRNRSNVESPKTPRTPSGRKIEPKTPESGRRIVTARRVLDTPRILRTNVKRCIDEVLNEEDDDEDYMNSDDSCYSDSDEEDRESNQADEEILATPSKKPVSENKKVKRTEKTIKSYSADDYFDAHVSTRVMTSNHSLNKLKKPQLDQDTILNALQKAPKKHEKEFKIIIKSLEAKFQRWQCLLLEGFSLLLYGLGSKAELLNSLRKFLTSDEDDAIVINGFFPSLTLREILSSIVRDLMEIQTVPSDEHECCNLILRHFNRSDSQHLYLLINNLDGQAIQTSKAQSCIARLSTAKKIHLVCTIDHINAPLLMDQGMLGKLNLVWQDATTMQPYLEETAYENSVMVQQSGKLALASLHSVFQSLTSNAKAILNILMENQLSSRESQYQGMSFRDLYHEAREQFVVSSDLALRGQLTEFLDHKLVKIKKGIDGLEMLHLPLPHAILKEFKATHDFDMN